MRVARLSAMLICAALPLAVAGASYGVAGACCLAGPLDRTVRLEVRPPSLPAGRAARLTFNSTQASAVDPRLHVAVWDRAGRRPALSAWPEAMAPAIVMLELLAGDGTGRMPRELARQAFAR